MNAQRARRERLLVRLRTQRDDWLSKGLHDTERVVELQRRIDLLEGRQAKTEKKVKHAS